MIKNLFCLFAIVLFCGCERKAPNRDFARTYNLKGTELHINFDLAVTSWLGLTNNRLIVRDDKPDSRISIFNLDSLQNPIFTGISGPGTCELQNPGKIINDKKGSFFVFDLDKKELFKFLLDSVKNANYKPELVFKTNEEGILNILKLNDTAYLANGIFLQKRFHLLDSNGHSFFKEGEYPKYNDSDIPVHVLAVANSASMTKHPTQTRIAAGLIYGDVFEIFDFDVKNRKIKLISQRKISEPQFTSFKDNGTTNFKTTSDTQKAYLQLVSNEKRIYALYSGMVQQNGVLSNTSNIIRVFDWDGKPLYQFKLDREVLKIVVDNKNLYALFDRTYGYDVVKYALTK